MFADEQMLKSLAADGDLPDGWVGRETNTLVLNYTMACPLACDFCCYACSPSRHEKMEIALALRLVEEAAAMGKFSSVGSTGGEPLLFADEIISIGRRLLQLGLPFTIATAAHWAEDRSAGEQLASKLVDLGLNRINISFDPSHSKFVSRNAVINAAESFARLGTEVHVIGTFFDRGQSVDALLPELRSRPDVNLISKYVAKVGRGKKFDITPEKYGVRHAASELTCYRRIYHDIVVFWDGKTYPCCSTFNRATEGILLGNANELSLSELYDRVEGRAMFTVMKHEGFGRFYEIVKEFDPALYETLPDPARAVGPCSLCNAIFKNRTMTARLKSVFDQYQSRRVQELLDGAEMLIGPAALTSYIESITRHSQATASNT